MKKLTSMLLVLCMLLAMLPVTAFAAEKKELSTVEVSLTDTGLVVGSRVPDATSKTEGVKVTTKWYTDADDEDTLLDDKTFPEGDPSDPVEYTVKITVEPVSEDYTLADSVTFTLNGEAVDVQNVEDNVLTAKVTVAAADGAYPITFAAGENGSQTMTSDAVVKNTEDADTTYTIPDCDFKPAEGYEFSGWEVTVPEEETNKPSVAKVDGKWILTIPKELAAATAITLTAQFAEVKTEQEIEEVAITFAYTGLKAGDTQPQITSGTTGVASVTAAWTSTEEGSTALEDGAKLAAGTYNVEVTVTADTDYTLTSNSKYKLNGTGDAAAFTSAENNVGKFTISGVQVAANESGNENAISAVTLTLDVAGLKVGSDLPAPTVSPDTVEIKTTEWKNADSEVVTGTFAKKGAHSVKFTVGLTSAASTAGKTLANDVVITVNDASNKKLAEGTVENGVTVTGISVVEEIPSVAVIVSSATGIAGGAVPTVTTTTTGATVTTTWAGKTTGTIVDNKFVSADTYTATITIGTDTGYALASNATYTIKVGDGEATEAAAIQANKQVTADVVVASDKYTIKFVDEDGKTVANDQSEEKGTSAVTVTLPTVAAEKVPEGKVFEKWTAPEGVAGLTVDDDNSTLTIAANYAGADTITLTAEFKDEPAYTVTFAGGQTAESGTITGSMDDLKVKKVADDDSTGTLPAFGFQSSKQVFDEWTISPAGVTVENNTITIPDSVDVETTITLTAKWKDPDGDTCTVRLQAGDGEGDDIDSLVVTSAENDTEYTLPECTFTAPNGKEFDAWSSDDEDYVIEDGVLTIPAGTEDETVITVTATWKDKTKETVGEVPITLTIPASVALNGNLPTATSTNNKVMLVTTWTLDGDTYTTATEAGTYTATIKVTPKNNVDETLVGSSYTFGGKTVAMTSDEVTIENAGSVTVQDPGADPAATGAVTVTLAAAEFGETLPSATTENEHVNIVTTWKFGGNTVTTAEDEGEYTATIKVTPKAGYTLVGASYTFGTVDTGTASTEELTLTRTDTVADSTDTPIPLYNIGITVNPTGKATAKAQVGGAEVTQAAKDDSVTISVTNIADGYRVKKVTFGEDEAETAPYTFRMPANAVTVTVTLEEIPVVPTYDITINVSETGKAAAEAQVAGKKVTKAAEDDSVTIAITELADGYRVAKVTFGEDEAETAPYTFTMPANAVAVTVEVEEIPAEEEPDIKPAEGTTIEEVKPTDTVITAKSDDAEVEIPKAALDAVKNDIEIAVTKSTVTASDVKLGNTSLTDNQKNVLAGVIADNASKGVSVTVKKAGTDQKLLTSAGNAILQNNPITIKIMGLTAGSTYFVLYVGDTGVTSFGSYRCAADGSVSFKTKHLSDYVPIEEVTGTDDHATALNAALKSIPKDASLYEEPQTSNRQPSSSGNDVNPPKPVAASSSSSKKPNSTAKDDDDDDGYDDGPIEFVPARSFSDVSSTDWYASAAAYVSERGMMSGNGGYFSPNQPLTRGMMAQILYNLDGASGYGTASFPDVQAGDWFASAVSWASTQRLMDGYGSGSFGPNDPITREQLASILYRYALARGYAAGASGELAQFVDGANTSSWASDAVRWAVGAGLLSGKSGGRLDPTGRATRAEVAQILMSFDTQIAK